MQTRNAAILALLAALFAGSISFTHAAEWISDTNYYAANYDGHYGPISDGYWGRHGKYFWYKDRSGAWHRDEGAHFQRDPAAGYSIFYGSGTMRAH